ncbi:MAG: hypothetical protein KDD70_17105 [Bdellovibrionales bacterium]|nr:hypothetical protein [Bdellovibrionales bacterium]
MKMKSIGIGLAFHLLCCFTASATDASEAVPWERISAKVFMQCVDFDGDAPSIPNVTVARFWMEFTTVSERVRSTIGELEEKGWGDPEIYRDSGPIFDTKASGASNFSVVLPAMRDRSHEGLPDFALAIFLLKNMYLISYREDVASHAFASQGLRSGNKRGVAGPVMLTEYVCKEGYTAITEISEIEIVIPSSRLEVVFSGVESALDGALKPFTDAVGEFLSDHNPIEAVNHSNVCGRYLNGRTCLVPLRPMGVSEEGELIAWHSLYMGGIPLRARCGAIWWEDPRECTNFQVLVDPSLTSFDQSEQ